MGAEELFGGVKVDRREEADVDVEKILPEIENLRDTALRYTHAVSDEGDVGGAGLDLEAAAIRYVRKLDVEQAKANRPDYGKIVEEAQRKAHDREDGN